MDEKNTLKLRVPHGVCPLVRTGTPTPAPASEWAPSPEPKGIRLRVKVGGPNSDDWRKSLVLCLLRGFKNIFQKRKWSGWRRVQQGLHSAGIDCHFTLNLILICNRKLSECWKMLGYYKIVTL